MQVPFNDLERQYNSIKSSVDEAMHRAFCEFNFVRGTAVGNFERAFAQAIGSKYCIATANGTDSLLLILKAIGVQSDSEVITPAFSWISSASMISYAGATPVFVDVDATDYTLDVEKVTAKISSKTRAVIAVHLYGQAAHAARLKELCKQHDIVLIEDCAQSQLTMERGQYVGTFGDAAAFSFYPTKNLGAYGDAGAVITSNDNIAERVRRLANHGALQKDDHVLEGINSRMDTIQASVLVAKLPYLPTWNKQRNDHASYYSEHLKGVGDLILPEVRPDTSHTFHLYVVRTKKRDALKSFLQEKGVQTIIHYPKALHNLSPYLHLGYGSQLFPVANALQDEVLSLPIYAELTVAQLDYVCENIREFFQM